MAKKLERKFVDPSLKIECFDDLKPYFENLKKRNFSTPKEIWQWLLDRSELESIIDEVKGWLYIKMNCNTADETLLASYERFVSEIEPEISLELNQLNKIFLSDEVLAKTDNTKLFTLIRETRKDLELFHTDNIEIEALLQQKEQEYFAIASKMIVKIENQELTLQQASNFLKETNRQVREKVYRLINDRRIEDTDTLNNLLTELIELRHKLATNAGFKNYSEYKFRELSRFDYTVDDCKKLHRAIAETATPIQNELYLYRKNKLKVETLMPFDLEVDEENLPPLKPFETVDELIQKTIWIFRDLDPEFGVYLNEMKKMGHIDLESRLNKAPGGFNYPLNESNVPFIFMNSTNNLDDVVTMIHEGGHAVHAYLCAHLELVNFKDVPSEIAELASMTMELLTMDHWHYFFPNEKELKRAKRNHLKSIMTILPIVAAVDRFQHFLYENPKHTIEERTKAWNIILDELMDHVVDYSQFQNYRKIQWQKYLHIFEVPFYYIEYGIAQLGAIAIWKQYKENKPLALKKYKEALKLGYTTTIPQTYEQAGIKFDFSANYIKSLMDFVKVEWENLLD